MKYCWFLVWLLAFFIFPNGLPAQTLTSQLGSEDPSKLAQQAREKGNIIRGAILFHQGNINCAKCHRSTSERDRIGPDLSRMDAETTDAMIVESILFPSRNIKKGYESVNALLIDGQTLSGMLVRQDEQQVVIRDRQNVDNLISISRGEIEELAPSKKSNMPENLADELNGRQQFLDLLRYVIDIRERGPQTKLNDDDTQTRRQLEPEMKGLVLVQKNNCVVCHDSEKLSVAIQPRNAPRLRWSAKWLNPEYLLTQISDPHSSGSGYSMPQMMNHLDTAERSQASKAILQYLTSTVENQFQPVAIDAAAAKRGFDHFHSVGCVACHSPQSPSKPVESISMGPISKKHSVPSLTQFLEDPLAARPSGHMPSMQLSHREAVDIANYLLQSSAPTEETSVAIDEQTIALGKTYFEKLRCNACHSDFDPTLAKPEKSASLEKLSKFDTGCLSKTNGDWPNYQFTDSETSSIQTALKKIGNPLSDEQQIELSLTSFNCIACHQRGDLGGVSVERNPHFKTTNLNLGDQGRIPPTLTGVGAKLNRKWMRDVLVNQRNIRPYMKTRMPQFGEANIGHLIDLFQNQDRLAEIEYPSFKDQKETRKRGLQLAGNQGLNCVACHTYKYKLSDTMPGVDLTEMAERLKKDWFYHYMLDPQKFSPNTVMPSFWPGGKAIRADIEGEPKEQIEALWQYLIDGRQAGTPRGVVREPLEIVVTNETKMLRRNYPGIGKRGIGVGYPGGVNLAFDAEQMRLGLIWKGKFVDPGGVWTGQGSGTARPMGRPVEFAKGPDLDYRDNPWAVDEGRPPNHKFRGYQLNAERQPTFRYEFDSVKVFDSFKPIKEPANESIRLVRSVAMIAEGQRDDLKFRIATHKDISPLSEQVFQVGKRLKVKVTTGQTLKIIDDGNSKSLEVDILLIPSQGHLLSIEYDWD